MAYRTLILLLLLFSLFLFEEEEDIAKKDWHSEIEIDRMIAEIDCRLSIQEIDIGLYFCKIFSIILPSGNFQFFYFYFLPWIFKEKVASQIVSHTGCAV